MMNRMFVVVALAMIAGCGANSSSSDSLVRAEVQRLETGSAAVEIEKAPVAAIAGLELFNATVMVPDHPGYRCAVHDAKVWCTGEERLSNVVAALGLGSKPDQLTDAAWLDLTTFLLDAKPLQTPGKADLLESYAPADARAKITAPAVTHTDQGVAVTFFAERVSYSGYPSGPMQLTQVTVLVSRSDTTAIKTDVVWDSDAAVALGDIGPDESACPPLTAAIVAAAEQGARCTDDAQCAIRDVGLCNLDGLGCYWVAHSTGQPSEPLDQAIAAYIAGCGRMSKCDCAAPPTGAACRDGSCTPTP